MKILKKFIPLIIIISIVVSYIMPIRVYAATNPDEIDVEIEDTAFDAFSDAGFASLDGIVGVLTWVFRAPLAAVIMVAETILSQVIMEGDIAEAGLIIDLEDIIFAGGEGIYDQVNILDVNYFKTSDDETVQTIQEKVAQWYYVLRNVAIAISLLVLIYLGIRMAISAIAEEQAKYKKMLKDWIVGFIILFSLHILMVVMINVNSVLTGIVYDIGGLGDTTLGSYEAALMKNMFSLSFVVSIGSILVILLMLGIKITFFYIYLKRVFTIGFLIVISPLITVTYSIDKLGDGQSQALNTWTKEFMFNLLIQPFHGIIYLVFVTAGISMLGTGSLKGILFSCAAMLFMFKAEDIVKNIFGFKAGSLGKLAGAITATNLLTSSKSGGSKSTGPVEGTGGGTAGTAGNGGSGSGVPGGAGVNRKPIPSVGNGGGGASGSGGQGPGSGGQGPGSSGQNSGGSQATNNSQTGNGNQSGANAVGSGAATPSRIETATGREKISSMLNQIKQDPKGMAQQLGNDSIKDIKSLALRGGAKALKAVPGVAAGFVVAGMTGNAIAGYTTGRKVQGRFTRNIANTMEERGNELKDEIQASQDENMEEALLLSDVQNKREDYLKWHPNEADIDAKEEELLHENPDNIEDKYEKEYAKSLEALNEFYENKNNLPVTNAAKNLMSNPKYNSQEELTNNTNMWMTQMDEANRNGVKYTETKEFKDLSRDEKKLAREIYASKKTIETKYKSGNNAIPDRAPNIANDRIRKAIAKGYDKSQET